jgi:hypothetical protein
MQRCASSPIAVVVAGPIYVAFGLISILAPVLRGP